MRAFRASRLIWVALFMVVAIVLLARAITMDSVSTDKGMRPSHSQGSNSDWHAATAASKGIGDSDRARTVGEVVVVESDASRAYRARSVRELEELLTALEPDSPDAFRLRWMVMHGCMPHSRAAQIDHVAPSNSVDGELPASRADRAQAVREQFWRQFCDLDTSVLYLESELWELGSEDARRNSTNPDLRFLQALNDELKQPNVPEKRESKRDRLADIISRTESPAVFEQAGRLLLSSAVVWPERIHPELLGSQLLRRQHDLPMAMTLASCRVFGGCEADSLIMGDLCSVNRCESAMDIDSYLREFHSPSMVRDANLLADILLQWRRQGPRFNE